MKGWRGSQILRKAKWQLRIRRKVNTRRREISQEKQGDSRKQEHTDSQLNM